MFISSFVSIFTKMRKGKYGDEGLVFVFVLLLIAFLFLLSFSSIYHFGIGKRSFEKQILDTMVEKGKEDSAGILCVCGIKFVDRSSIRSGEKSAVRWMCKNLHDSILIKWCKKSWPWNKWIDGNLCENTKLRCKGNYAHFKKWWRLISCMLWREYCICEFTFRRENAMQFKKSAKRVFCMKRILSEAALTSNRAGYLSPPFFETDVFSYIL